jgi:hypothetical protein
LLADTYAGVYGGGQVTPVPVADVARAFSTFDDWRNINIRKLCRFTEMCERAEAGFVISDWNPAPGPQPDIHPTDIGYRRIAREFKRTMIRSGII